MSPLLEMKRESPYLLAYITNEILRPISRQDTGGQSYLLCLSFLFQASVILIESIDLVQQPTMWRSIVYFVTVLHFTISFTVASTITVPLYRRIVPPFYAANGQQLDDGLVCREHPLCCCCLETQCVTRLLACRWSEHRQPTSIDEACVRYQ
jgi:hypothetical protein